MIGVVAAVVHEYGGRALSQVERSWGALSFERVRWQTAEQTEGLTRRAEHQLIVTLSGTTRRTTARLEDGRAYDGVDFPGATTFIPSMRERTARYGGGVIDFASMRLDPELLDSLDGLGNTGGIEFRGVTNVPDPLAQRLALELGDELRHGGAAGGLFVDNVATMLMLHLVRRYSNLARGSFRNSPPPLTGAALRRVLDYVHDNLGDDLRLAALAELAGVERFRFSRCFKAATGLSPHRYVTERRLERAARLLRANSGLPIADIAYQLGFSSQSHLTTAFRRRFGTTPHAYRMAVRA
jgi:AraC family transcriptional regulator